MQGRAESDVAAIGGASSSSRGLGELSSEACGQPLAGFSSPGSSKQIPRYTRATTLSTGDRPVPEPRSGPCSDTSGSRSLARGRIDKCVDSAPVGPASGRSPGRQCHRIVMKPLTRIRSTVVGPRLFLDRSRGELGRRNFRRRAVGFSRHGAHTTHRLWLRRGACGKCRPLRMARAVVRRDRSRLAAASNHVVVYDSDAMTVGGGQAQGLSKLPRLEVQTNAPLVRRATGSLNVTRRALVEAAGWLRGLPAATPFRTGTTGR